MRNQFFIILLIAILLLTGTECLSEDGKSYLQSGLKAYKEEANFGKAISELQEAIRLGLSDRNDLIQAHLYLGFAYMGNAEKSAAEIEFSKAIKLDPTLELDPNRHSTKVISAFNGMREGMVDSLTVVSIPGGAEVYLDGSEVAPVGNTPLTLNNMLIGEHSIRVIKNYFLPKSIIINVNKGEANRVQVELEKAEIELRITSQPSEALVYVISEDTGQDQPQGQTPALLKAILDQELTIRLAKEEFISKELRIKMTEAGIAVSGIENVIPLENGMGTVYAELAPAPPPGRLKVVSDPPGASVRLDGVNVGETPLTIARVTPGKRRVRIGMSGFSSITKNVEIISDQEAEIEVALGGVLNISSMPGDAQVFIDEKYVGLTPMKTSRIPSGSHQLRLTREKYKDKLSAVIVDKGRDKQVNLRMLPLRGSVAVSSEPSGADVYLDGQKEGSTPLFIYGVIAGRHSLKLTKTGYEDQEKQFVVEELKVSWQFGKLKLD